MSPVSNENLASFASSRDRLVIPQDESQASPGQSVTDALTQSNSLLVPGYIESPKRTNPDAVDLSSPVINGMFIPKNDAFGITAEESLAFERKREMIRNLANESGFYRSRTKKAQFRQ